MIPFDFKRAVRARLVFPALAAAGVLLAACGQASSSTTVVLTGPPDQVRALIDRHPLLKVQAQTSTLEDGRRRAVLHLAKGLPMGEAIALGKDAAKAGVSYEFSSGTRWDSGSPPPDARLGDGPAASPPEAPAPGAPAPDAPSSDKSRPGGRVV